MFLGPLSVGLVTVAVLLVGYRPAVISARGAKQCTSQFSHYCVRSESVQDPKKCFVTVCSMYYPTNEPAFRGPVIVLLLSAGGSVIYASSRLL